MGRAIWKGSLSFGLISINVEMHSAVRDARPRFRLLHREDESPIRLEHICRVEGVPVAWDDLVKGYEYEKGRFVVLTREDFEAAALEKSRTVDILDFVNEDDIDDRFFDTPYYLVPGKGAERAYALLREAIRRSDKVGVAKVVLRQVQHLAALSAVGDALLLTTMRFADDLVDTADLVLPGGQTRRTQEIKMGVDLIESLTSKWSPEKYTDDYRANLMRIVHARLKGRKPRLVEPDEEPPSGQVINLMERLRESLKGEGRPARTRRAAPRKRARKRVA